MNQYPDTYKVHFKLKGVNDLAGNMLTMVYGPGIEYKYLQIERYKDSNPEYAKTLSLTVANVEDLRRRTSITSNDDGSLDFAFEVDNSTDKFNEQEQDGKRPWLRNYVDDFFYTSVLSHLVRVQSQRKDYNSSDLESFHRLFEAFEKALEHAYLPKSDQFWIDNELDTPIDNNMYTP